MTRIIVCGSRLWPWDTVVWEALDRQVERSPDRRIAVVHGACPTGVDDHASLWARRYKDVATEERHPAQWRTYGKRAGFLRNEEMVQCGADLVLAFRLNGSAGTTLTIDLARAARIPSVVMDAYL